MSLNPDLKTLYPFDIDKAFEKISELGSNIVFSDGYAKVAQFLADGEVDMIVIPNGRMVPLIADGAPVAINWNQHLRFPNFFVIPRGAPHADAAKKFLAWVCEPERLAALAKPTNYGPINTDAYKFIDADVAPLLPGNPATAELGRIADTAWLGEHRQDIARGWARLGVR
jgi:putative spermidine/putrescine transport system substrate-binding protein